MALKRFLLAACLILTVLSVPGLEFSSGDWELTLHPENGSWNELYYQGKLICTNPEKQSLLWLKRENAEGKLLFLDASLDEKSGVLTILTQQGSWKFEERITFGKDLRRQYSVTWLGDAPARMWEHNIAFPMPKTGTFYLPCAMFGDLRTYYEEITQVPEHASVIKGEMAKIKQGEVFKGSMDHAGFVYFQPDSAYTVTLIADAASLPSRAFIKGLSKEIFCEFYAASCGWAVPNQPQKFPEFRLVVEPGTIADAIKTVPHRYFREIGMVPPKDREDWLVDASIWELNLIPGFGATGGFIKAAEKRLPYIRLRGFNTLWIQPIEFMLPYNPEDYFRIREDIGTEEEYRSFIKTAHNLGFRVLQDVVPHGNSPEFAEGRGVSPFTVSIMENGECVPNMSFDYSSPEWRNYFYGVISHWMKIGVDGFRVDQCGASPANWRLPNFPKQAPKAFNQAYWDAAVAKNGGRLPAIEGSRADDSLRLGPMKLTEGIRKTARSRKADAGILGEGGSHMQPFCDVVVDMPIRHAILKMLFFSPEEYTRLYLQTMHEKYWMDPPDIRRVSLFEIHDNNFRASQIVGEAPAQALRATWFWNRSVPAVMDGRDLGQGVLLARLNLLRDNLEELRRGDIDFKAVSSEPQLFSPLRFMPEKSSVCVTSFYPYRVEAKLSIPTEKLGFSAGSEVELFDAFLGKKLDSGKLEHFRKVKIALPPYGSAVLTFRPAGSACPLPPVETAELTAPAPIPLSVVETTDTVEVKGSYPLVIDKKNGMILCYGTQIGKSDILSDIEIPRVQPAIRIDRSAGKVAVEADFDKTLKLIYTVGADSLTVKGILLEHQKNSRYAFLLSATGTKRWQLFGADGVRDDFIDPALIDVDTLGCTNEMHREHLFSPVLHRTLAMPLNPAFPVIRLFDAEKHGLEIVQSDPFDPSYDEVMLLDRMKRDAGIHVAFFWNQPGPVSTAADAPRSFEFVVRPASQKNPDEAAAKINGIDFRFSGVNWLASTGRFKAHFGKNGGVLKSIRFNGETPQQAENQDVIAQGFTTAFRTPGRASFDMETHCRILRTDSGVELRFLSWLRNFANFGVILPPIWNCVSYRLEPASDKLESDWNLYVTKVPQNPEATLVWRADSNGGEVVIPVDSDITRVPQRRWLGFSADFTAGGIRRVKARRVLEKQTYPPLIDWKIHSFSDRKSHLAKLASDLPENWICQYIPGYQVIPRGNTISYRFDLPVMWPHTVTPVALAKGRYRASTMLRTQGVKKEGGSGTLRFKLSYLDADGKKQLIDHGYTIPDGDSDWRPVTVTFEVPEGATGGEFTVLAYKVFGKGRVQFDLPTFERIE